MKKIFVLFVCLVMILSSVCAYAALPRQLTKMPLNYSSDMSFSMTMQNADELADYILSVEPDVVTGMFDLRTFLGALFNVSGKRVIKGDVSEDYKKIKLHIGGEATYNINLNRSLDIAVTPRAEMWINLDISDAESPVFDIVILSPLHAKYVEINVFDIIPGGYTQMVYTLMDSVLNKQFIDGFTQKSVGLIEKYASIKTRGSECTVTFDDEGMKSMTDELMSDFIAPLEELAKEYLPEGASDELFAGVSEYDEVNSVWKSDVVIKYTLSRDSVTSEKCDVNMDINISDLYAVMSGHQWQDEEDLIVSLDMTTDAGFYDFGRTKVEFPELDETNSINLSDMYSAYTGYEYSEQYPLSWFELNPDKIYNIDSVVYVPLRAVLEKVYGENVSIENQNGTITITSELFEDFEKITLKEWDKKVYLDDSEYEIGGVAVLDGTEFVDNKFFEEVMGWEIYSLYYDVIEGIYHYSGSTWNYEYEDYEIFEPEYPVYSVDINTGYLPFKEGQVYFPLREVIETAYQDSAVIGYDNGKIRIESEYFPGFKVLEITEGDTRVYADGAEYEIGGVFTEGGKAYVHPALFSEILGWDLWQLHQYMDDESYSFTYWTRN